MCCVCVCFFKVTIKAIASTKDLFKESSVVTRTFTVKDVGLPESSEESDEEEVSAVKQRKLNLTHKDFFLPKKYQFTKCH